MLSFELFSPSLKISFVKQNGNCMFLVFLCVSERYLYLETQSGFCVLAQVDENFLLSVVKFSLFVVLSKNLLK